MMWWWGDGHMGAAGWVGMVFMIILWIAIIVGLVYLLRYILWRPGDHWHGHHPGGPPGSVDGRSDATRILEERYARGEIDREEFLQRRADLEHRV
jgi:putative membrane protein